MNKQYSRHRSKEIDKGLLRDQEIKRKEVQILLTGCDNSGKMTVGKQARIQYGDGYPISVRRDLVPTIVANLADATSNVLKLMQASDVEFTDPIAQKLGQNLLSCCPREGFVVNMECKEGDAITGDNNANANDDTFAKLNQQVTAGLPPSQSQSNVVPNSYANNEAFTDLLINLLNDYNTIPPSLIKRLEYIADPIVVDNLRAALSDTSQLRAIIADSLGQAELINSVDQPPPIPSTSPPMTLEEELIECITQSAAYMINDHRDSSSDGSPGSDSGDSQTISDSQSSLNPVVTPVVDIAQTLVEYNHNSDPEMINQDEIDMTKRSYNILGNFISPQLNSTPMKTSSQPHSTQSFIIIMKIIIEQPEFKEVISSESNDESIITYSNRYFIDQVDRIIQEDYIPTLQDILRMKESRAAIMETDTLFGSIGIKMATLTVKGSNLRKHLHYFESVHTVFYILSLDDLCSDNLDKNLSEKSIWHFKQLIQSRYLQRKDFTVFLNKIDQLEKRNSPQQTDVNHTDVLDKVKAELRDAWSLTNDRTGTLKFYVTCALDIDHMKWILQSCLKFLTDSIIKKRITFL